MKTKLIALGNNKVITIPPEILEKWQGIDTFEIKIENNHLAIYPINKPRDNWEQQFKQLDHKHREELIINDNILNEWDREEWQW